MQFPKNSCKMYISLLYQVPKYPLGQIYTVISYNYIVSSLYSAMQKQHDLIEIDEATPES